MRQICPHCAKMIELPDEGREAACPLCQKTVPIPQTYSVQVDPIAVKPIVPPTPIPPLPPPIPVQVQVPVPIQSQTAPAPAPMTLPPINGPIPAPPPGYTPSAQIKNIIPSNYQHSVPFTLSLNVVPWVAVVGLTLIFLLMPFPWCGSYPGGLSAYTQSFWGALGNSMTTQLSAESILKEEANIRGSLRSDWWLMIPYLLCVLVAAGLAWADRLVIAPDFAFRNGPFNTLRAMVWPRKSLILFALTAVALGLFALESLRGFGLESSCQTVVTNRFEKKLSEAGTSSVDREKVRYETAIDLARFGLDKGYSYWLVALAHVVVVAAAGLRLWLDDRGFAKPAPRLMAEW
jgi:hypothetical protein